MFVFYDFFLLFVFFIGVFWAAENGNAIECNKMQYYSALIVHSHVHQEMYTFDFDLVDSELGGTGF